MKLSALVELERAVANTSKGIIAVDIPETCLDCKFCCEIHEGVEACCGISDETSNKGLCRTIEVSYCNEKPEWCPIREVPQKKEKKPINDYLFGQLGYAFMQGWNACVDEILKGGDGI